MFGLYAELLAQSAFARWVFVVSLIGSIVFAWFATKELQQLNEQHRMVREAALKLWLEECPHAVDQCTLSWDRSYTLRIIYKERVEQ